jgi:hypothetical protein
VAFYGFFGTLGVAAGWVALYSDNPSGGAIAGMVVLSVVIIAEGLAVLMNWRGWAFAVAAGIWSPEDAARRRWRLQAQAWGANVMAMGVIALVETVRVA